MAAVFDDREATAAAPAGPAGPAGLCGASGGQRADAAAALTSPRPALRFLTAGSVDDGKSTLIGRLLFDSRAILADQLQTLEARSTGAPRAGGGPAFDLSLLTDGLEAEREQGITIDVAYRYFATKARKFIIADAPGHEQYTRNMVTAAAGSDAAVVLVDITKLDLTATPVQLLPQTRRHTLLAQLLRVPHIVFAVNKIDAAADPGAAFAAVSAALRAFAAEAALDIAAIVPVSALRGDNVTLALDAAWYRGPSLLQVLEGLPAAHEPGDGAFSLPVQYVARDGAHAAGEQPAAAVARQQGLGEQPPAGLGEQPRVLWGRIAQGSVRVGDAVQVFPSGERATVAALRHAGGSIADNAAAPTAAHPRKAAGQSAGIVLDRQLDVSRGDWLATPDTLQPTQRFSATLAWLDTEPATPGRKYWLRHGNRWVQGRLAAVRHRLDIHTLQPLPADTLAVNEIGSVVFQLQQALPLAPYAGNRVGGALIVVDSASHRTSGALLVVAAADEAAP